MKRRTLIGIFISLALYAQAMPIHPFPGIDGLIEDAEHIAVITIVGHISGDGQGYDEYLVRVRHTLKGTVPEGETMAMSLLYVGYHTASTGTMDSGFVNRRTYLVFLEDNQASSSKAPYRSLQTMGSYWEVSLPHPDWRQDPDVSIRETIELLVRKNLQWKERVLMGDRATFSEVFGEEKAENGEVREPAGGATRPAL